MSTTATTVPTTTACTTTSTTCITTTTTVYTSSLPSVVIPGNQPPTYPLHVVPPNQLLNYYPSAPSTSQFTHVPFSYHLPNYAPFDSSQKPIPQNHMPAMSPAQNNVFDDPNSMSALKTIETYSGGPELLAFLDNVATVAECYRWTDAQVVTAIKLKLRGDAQTYFYSLPGEKRLNTVLTFRDWLVNLFGKKTDTCTSEREFCKLFRRRDESLRKFALRLEIAATKLIPEVYGDEMLKLRNRIKRETLLIKQFLDGLDTRLANEICRIKQFETIEEALPYAEHCEEVLARLYKETRADVQKSSIRAMTVKEGHRKVSDTKRQVSPQRASGSKSKGWRTDQRYPQMRGRCFNCGSLDHTNKACSAAKQKFCYACVKPGHSAKDATCPLNSKSA